LFNLRFFGTGDVSAGTGIWQKTLDDAINPGFFIAKEGLISPSSRHAPG
jgi:hypothetical protein